MENNFSLKEFLRYRKNDAKKLTAALLTLGVILMLTEKGGFFGTKKESVKTQSSEILSVQRDENEKKLEEILSAVKGAGKVKVMITYSQGAEKIAAQETKRDEKDDGENTESSYESTYVLKDKSDGGTEEVVLTEYMPCAMGVLIVAQGGDDIYVKQALSSAAQALLNVPAHKVEVLKMEG